ncbi:MAG: hypothetical protein FWF54_07800 [Candidatus Azobacteroides sp.]|nr:hypothetical protein [Candidatus Azobacteroides sp.]
MKEICSSDLIFAEATDVFTLEGAACCNSRISGGGGKSLIFNELAGYNHKYISYSCIGLGSGTAFLLCGINGYRLPKE